MSHQIQQSQEDHHYQDQQPQVVDQAYQEIVQEIIEDNTQQFGAKNKPRNEEPSMFQLLSWQPKEQEQWDYKSNNPDILHSQGYQKYKSRIARTEDPFASEQRDQYRRYHHDKVTGAVLPDFDLDQFELLRQEKEGFRVPQQQGVPLEDNQQVRKVQQQQLEYSDVQDKLFQNQKTLKKKGPKAQQQQQQQKSSAGIYHYKDQEELDYEQLQQEQQQQNIEGQEYQEEDYQDGQDSQQNAYQRPIPTTDPKKVKSKLLSYKKQAKKLDPVYEKERLDRRQERINAMEGTTRWLPNSAFTTYFGKPAFENYGMGNTKPTVGGMIYGQYLLSHNVNPHRGTRQPQYHQSHKNALDYGERLPESEPQPPRNCKEEFRLSQKQVQDHISRNPLVATKNTRDNLKIVKPDLVNSLRFASEENSPEPVEDEETRRKKLLEQNKSFKRVSKTGKQLSSQQNSVHNLSQQQTQQINRKSVQIQEPEQQQQKQQSDDQQQQQLHQKQQKQQPSKSSVSQQQQISNKSSIAQKPAQNKQQISQTVKQQDRKQPSAQQQKQRKQQQQKKNKKQEQQQEGEEDEIPEYERQFFMEEVRRKKAASNRLALKVTEVIPVPSENTRPQSANPNLINQNRQQLENARVLQQQQQQEQSAVNGFDDMNPPEGYLEEVQDYELNPQNYRNIPPQWMKRIPYAGKKLTQEQPLSIFH